MVARVRRSREAFRSFIRARGIFGRRPSPDDRAEDSHRRRLNPAQAESRGYIRRYFHLLRGQRSHIILIMGMSLLLIALRSSLPWGSKLLIDFVLPQRDFVLLAGCCVLMLAFTLSSAGLGLLQDYVTRTLRGNLVTGIKRRLMKHLQQMPLERVQELKVGGIVSRLQTDTERLAGLLRGLLLSPFNSCLMLFVALSSLFVLNWRVACVCLVVCLGVAGLAFVIFNLLRPFQRSLRKDRAEISGHVAEVFAGVEVVRAFKQERLESSDYAVESHLLWRKQLHGDTLSMLLHRFVWILYSVLTVSIWLYGGYQYIEDPEAMPLGSLVAFITFTHWLFQPVFQIMGSFAEVQVSMACAERVFDLLDEPVAMPDKPDAVPIRSINSGIRFADVSFQYPAGTQALDGLDLVIEHGKVTALVGSSGAGKSTVTNLLMRFYDPTSGAIQINGRDIRDYRLMTYRSRLSLVLQEVFLFDGSVGENIAYGRSDAGRDEIEEAARVANCHDFIMELDDGYDTMVGERGVKLSGGQRQRIALARAVLTDPDLLILDEATSNLDSESENLIQEALTRIFKDRTTLIIAHRLSTIMDADKIVVLEKGHKVEEGTHEELLDLNGRYAEMLRQQLEKANATWDHPTVVHASRTLRRYAHTG